MDDFNQDRAFNEGWCVSECNGSTYFPEGWLDIQRLDEANVFENDWQATAHVHTLAASGSEYHRDAIRYAEENNFKLTLVLNDSPKPFIN